jgi:hypothetical protein
VKQLLDPSPARAAAYVALYPMLVSVARRHGYALAIHGTVTRDFDLIAIPWVETASDALTLIKAIKKATATVIQHEEFERIALKNLKGTPKPHGRKAFSLHFTNHGMYGGYLDVSIMPLTKKKGISHE